MAFPSQPAELEVFDPQQAFGGVQVFFPDQSVSLIEINTGSPVQSVFGRIGAVTAQEGDYTLFYAPLGTGLPPGGIPGQVVQKTGPNDYDAGWRNPATSQVSSVFGRIGAIVAQPGDYSAAQVTNAVSIIGSYANPAWITSLAWTKITGAPATFSGKFTDLDFTGSNLASIAVRNFADLQSKPTTLAGYGITPAAGDYAAFYQPLGSYEVPLTFQSSVYRNGNVITLLGDTAPATSPGNNMFYGTNASGTRGWYALPAAPTIPVTSVFTRTGAITAQVGDYAAFYQPLGSYEGALGNPSANGYILSSTTAGVRSWIAPPSAPVSSVFTRTGAVVAAANDYTFAQIGSKPTTISGYGITDAEHALGNPSTDGMVLSSTAAGVRSWITPSAAAPVSSVFGRTGAIAAVATDYTPAFIGAEPALGNPAANGYILSSTTAGVRSWIVPPAGGSGTVTNFGANNLSPLFTTSVANPSTTPVLSFALQNQAINTVYGNASTVTAAPSFTSSPRFTAIGNLTTNGFVKTGGGLGTLSVDTNVYLTGNQTITLSGDVTGSGTTAIAVTVPGAMPAGGTAGQVLAKNSATNFDASWVSLASLQTSPFNGANFSSTGVMYGTARPANVITPVKTGKLLVTVFGRGWNSTAGSGAQVTIYYGTGTPPLAGNTIVGTSTNASAAFQNSSASNRCAFSVTALLTGLAIGTQIWIDLAAIVLISGTGTLEGVTIVAVEIP